MQDRTVHQSTTPDDGYVDLQLLFQSLIDKKWLIIILSFMSFSLTAIYTAMKPSTFQASILLKIQHKQQNILNTITNPTQELSLSNTPEEPLAVQIALIQSEFVLRPVIKRLSLDINLRSNPNSFFGYVFKNETKLPVISQIQLPAKYIKTPMQLVIDQKHHYRIYDQHGSLLIQGNEGQLSSGAHSIEVIIDKLDAPIGSKFTFIKEPEFEILNKIRTNLTITDLSGTSDHTNNQTAILRVTMTGTDPVFISTILNQIAITTKEENTRLKAQESEKTLVFLNKQIPIVNKSLRSAESQLNIFREKNGNFESKIQSQNLHNHLSDINKQFEQVRMERAKLLQKYTEFHPSVIAFNQEIIQLTKYQNDLLNQLKNQPAFEQQYLDLTREVEVKNNLYMLLLNQIHQLEVIKTGIVSDVQILTDVSAPHILSQTRPFTVGIFGLFVGFILGCIIVLTWRLLTQCVSATAENHRLNEANNVREMRQHNSVSS